MILKPEKPSSIPGSYRPISLLPVIGKLFERVMTVRITIYMVSNKLINKYQCGFLKGKSCAHQLLRLSEHKMTWFNKKPTRRTVAIFIDAEKAFNTVWIQGLMKKRHDSKIPITIVRWLSSFLQNRHGCISVNCNLSRKFSLLAEVPQGNILVPLLYIFFISDMPTEAFEAMISSSYADDTSYQTWSRKRRDSRWE